MKDSLFFRKYYKWFIWLMMAVIYNFANFHKLSLGAIKNDLGDSFGLSATAFANLSSMLIYAYLIMQIPTGILVDKYGTRLVISIGTLISGVGSLLFSYSENTTQAYISRFIVGIGVAVPAVCLIKILSVWFKETEFATMFGLTTFLGLLGGILAQSPLVLMVQKLSWRGVFSIIGLTSIILSFLSWIIIKDIGNKKNIQIEVSNPQSSYERNYKKGLLLAIKNRYTWISVISVFGMFGFSYSTMGIWGASYLTNQYNLSKIEASNHLIFIVIGVAIGSILSGYISDKIKRRKLTIIGMYMINILLSVIMIYFSSVIITYNLLGSLLFMIGLTSSSCTLVYSISKELNHPSFVGTSGSFINTGAFLGVIVIPFIMGNVIDVNSKILSSGELYSKAFSVALLFLVISLIATFFLKETRCENIYIRSDRASKTSSHLSDSA